MIIDELGPAPEEFIPHIPRALSPMVRRIPTENSDVNTYLIGVDEILVLNPGPASQEHFDAISGCGGDHLKWVSSTSSDKNYSGGKSSLAKELGLVKKNLKPGDMLQSTEFKLSCFGCSDNDVIFYLEEEYVLFCNDILSATASDPLYKGCLKLSKQLKLRRIAPSKGQIIEDFGKNLATRLAELSS